MRNRLWLSISMMIIATLILAACGGGAAPAAPAEEAAPTEAPAEEAAAEEEAPAEEAAEATEEAAEESAEEAAAEATEAPAEESAAAASGGPTLTIWADEVRAPVLEEIAAGFSDQYGVSISVVQKGFGDLRGDFIVAAPTGEGPDILLGSHDWIGELNASGLLAPIDLGANADSFAPNAVASVHLPGRQPVRYAAGSGKCCLLLQHGSGGVSAGYVRRSHCTLTGNHGCRHEVWVPAHGR